MFATQYLKSVFKFSVVETILTMPVSRSGNKFHAGYARLRPYGNGRFFDTTAPTIVDRYTGCGLPTSAAHTTRTASVRRHQLKLSGLGLLKGCGFAFFLPFGRAFGFVRPGIGNGRGLGMRRCPTTSLTSIEGLPKAGVIQNHQPELISTDL